MLYDNDSTGFLGKIYTEIYKKHPNSHSESPIICKKDTFLQFTVLNIRELFYTDVYDECYECCNNSYEQEYEPASNALPHYKWITSFPFFI